MEVFMLLLIKKLVKFLNLHHGKHPQSMLDTIWELFEKENFYSIQIILDGQVVIFISDNLPYQTI